MTAVPPQSYRQTDSPPNSPAQRKTRIALAVEGAIAATEFNQLCLRAGKPPRDLVKLTKALDHSLFCVTARKVSNRELVGYVRACGDGVFNAEILDLIVYPREEQGEAIKKQLILRLKREVRRTMPKCAISAFALPEDLVLLLRANFEKDPDGIRAMALPLGGWADQPALYLVHGEPD
ncbi:MAG: hypothetical protein HC824_16665 [Synechococcales cyanobacterium RM1_1_8]|nr:hypothetical protein [Synechococcales cyanobacterium RM1_1_8]